MGWDPGIHGHAHVKANIIGKNTRDTSRKETKFGRLIRYIILMTIALMIINKYFQII